MTFSQIETFVELSREKSFSRTADKLGVTQSAVSHAIKKLEQELGVNLISRERKEFQVTETGSNLLIYCREILQQMQNIELEVASKINGTKGTIRLGTLWSVCNTILPKLLNACKRKFPTVDISVLEGTDREIENWLLTRAIDVGIFTRKNEQLELTKLTEDRFYAIVSENNSLASAKMLDLKQLEKYPFIMSKGGCEPYIQSIAQYHQTTLNVRFEASEIFSIATMVRENLGVSMMPELAIPKDFPGIRYIPLNTEFRRNIYLGRLKGNRFCRMVNGFVDQLLSTPF